MVRLPRFEYSEPDSLEGALSLLAQHEGEVGLVAGGTEQYVQMKQRIRTPRYLVSLKAIPDLDVVEYNAQKGLKIGPLAILESIESNPDVQKYYPGLGHAAGLVASPAIRNVGTIGGNVCLDTRCWYYNQSHNWRKSLSPCYKRGGDICYVAKGGDHCYALCMSDTAPALMALGASVTLCRAGEKREVALKDFFTNNGEKVNRLEPGEILTEIRVPPVPPRTGSVYIKYATRKAIDFPILGVAAVVSLEPENGTCKDASIVVGGVGSAPVLVERVGEVMKGQELSDGVMEEVGSLAARSVYPATHMKFSGRYKKKVVPVYVRRAMKAAVESARRVSP